MTSATGEARPEATQLRHGYTLDALNELAHTASRRDRWHRGMELPERYQVAWSAIVAHRVVYTYERNARGRIRPRVQWIARRVFSDYDHHRGSRATGNHDRQVV